MDGLTNCQEKIKDFVIEGHKRKIIPLPGIVDVICGGPPCQGISGFNRFRNKKQPLEDEKNKQLLVFMDIVEFLRPRFVLMENVVDMFRFAGSYLGRYAFARLVQMNYQARLGLMVAGAYGLAQFRMRAFLWAVLPSEKLPQYPFFTHDVIVRGNVPKEFESCFVAYEEGSKPALKWELLLADVISDLPQVANDETRDEMPYVNAPDADFQRFIRRRKDEMPGSLVCGSEMHLLYDHCPLHLNLDDLSRVRRIPRRKIPGYAVSFMHGVSTKPFGRLWWDETVPTVVTRAEPHNQVILHPSRSSPHDS